MRTRRSLMLLFSHSAMSHSLQPHGLQHSRLPCPSPSLRVYSLTSIESMMSSNHLILYLPQSFPVSGTFPRSWLFALGGQRIRASASASSCWRVSVCWCNDICQGDSSWELIITHELWRLLKYVCNPQINTSRAFPDICEREQNRQKCELLNTIPAEVKKRLYFNSHSQVTRGQKLGREGSSTI